MQVFRLIVHVLISLQTSGVAWPNIKAQSSAFRVDLSAEKIVIDVYRRPDHAMEPSARDWRGRAAAHRARQADRISSEAES